MSALLAKLTFESTLVGTHSRAYAHETRHGLLRILQTADAPAHLPLPLHLGHQSVLVLGFQHPDLVNRPIIAN